MGRSVTINLVHKQVAYLFTSHRDLPCTVLLVNATETDVFMVAMVTRVDVHIMASG